MKSKLKILFVEDVPSDFELIKREIKKNGIEFADKLVETREDYTEALQSFKPDIILSDYSLPQFNGMQALEIRQKETPDVPFILITGALNEETAVEIMKAGADDYIIKNQLTRIGSAIKSAIGKWESNNAKKQAEDALKESEKRFRELANLLPQIVFEIDIHGKLVYLNELGYELFGFYREDTKDGLNVIERIAPEDRERAKSRIREILSGRGNATNHEYVALKKDGSRFPVLIYSSVILKENVPIGIRGVVIDITDRKQAQEALEVSEKQYRRFFEKNISGVYLSTPQGQLLDCNPAFAEMLGYSIPELIELDTELLYPSPANRSEFLHKLTVNKNLVNSEIELVRKDGHVINCIENVVGIFNQDGELIEFQGYVADVTKRKKAEERIRKLSQAVEQSPVSIVITDLKGDIEYTNPKFTELTGYLAEEALGKNPSILKSGETPLEVYKELWKTITSGNEWRGEFHNKKKNGELFWEFASISPIRNKEGKITHYLGVKEDMTERKKAIDDLHASEQRFRSMFENHSAVMLLIDPDSGKIIDSNRAAVDYYGYSHNKLVSKNIDDINMLTPGEIKKNRKLAAERKVNLFNFKHRLKDNSVRDVQVHSTPIEYKDQKLLFSIIYDVTEQKRAAKALKESEEKYRNLIETTSEGFWLLNNDNITVDVNNSLCEMLGYSKDEIIGKTPFNFVDWVNSSIFEKQTIKSKTTKHRIYEVTMRRKDGDYFPTIFNATTLQDDEGKQIGSFAFITDITERKIAEEEIKRSANQLRELTKYTDAKFEEERKRIGNEIHDGIGQLLTSIIMDLQWVEKKWPEESALAKDKFKSMVSTINTGVKEVQKLSIELRPKMLDNLGLIETIQSEAEKFDEKTGIYCDVQFEPEYFEVDYERTSTIYRILMELLTNTYRYADAKKVAIKLERKKEAYLLTFIDDGIGITEDQINSRSSFGLITILERVNKWHGTFKISGEHKKGTTVQVTIPF